MEVGCVTEVTVGGRDYGRESHHVGLQSAVHLGRIEFGIVEAYACRKQQHVHAVAELYQFREPLHRIRLRYVDTLCDDIGRKLLLQLIEPFLTARSYAHAPASAGEIGCYARA